MLLAFLLLASLPVGAASVASASPLCASASPATSATGPIHYPVRLPTTDLPPRHARSLPAPRFAVDPTALYSAEPAPMGIADFGVNPATGNGYTYTTTAFWAVTTISSLSTRNNALSDPHDLTIQLNANFEITSGSNSFTYWVQDVAFLNSSTNVIAFIDNVWNMSSSGASMYNSTITGNGTVASAGSVNFYYDVAGFSLAGNDVALTYPSVVNLEMTVTPHGGRPGVAFRYDDGSGWVTYDNIGIRFGSGYTVNGLVVDGTNYNSAGLFNDAELTLGGPGGGASTTDLLSQLTMSLSFFNGHNFQPVTNAYDFGSDTAEAISNVDPSGQYWPTNGTLFATEPNGSGSLTELYDRSFVGILNISSLLPAGFVTINGTSYGNFTGRDMNLTIAPGTYAVALFAANGSLVGSQRVAVADGAYVPVHFGAAVSYRVTFQSVGLPASAPWSVTFDGVTVPTTNSTVAFLAVNGTYSFAVAPIAGYAASPWGGNLTVAGSALTQPILWSKFTYTLTFAEDGLPNGTSWGVRVNSVSFPTTNASVSLSVVNGTYSYFVATVPGYLPSPATGNVNVSGHDATVTITFGLASYAITLTETGLPAGWIWAATLNGVTHSSGGAAIAFGLPNGTYPFSITSVAGYTVSPRVGNLTVAGQPVPLPITFSPVLYDLVFAESGLPAGSSWSVTIDSTAQVGTTATLTFSLPNGTYAFTVGTSAPYVAGITTSSVSIAGEGGELAIPFSPVNGLLQGTVQPSTASVFLNGTLVATAGGWLNLTLLPGDYELEVTLAGYVASDVNVTVRAGAVTPFYVTLSPAPPPPTTHHVTSLGPGGLSTIEWLALAGVAVAALAVVAGAYVVSRRRRRQRWG